jgi:hypothetical protein
MKKIPFFFRILAVSGVVFLLGSIPYYAAYERQTGELKFLGQIAYPEDQNMYFSFIRQAYDGALIFKNRLTYLQHTPVVINVQWLAVGLLERFARLSENQVYQVWRFAGMLTLVSGFFVLSSLFFAPGRRRFLARTLFFFGGGLGFFVLAAYATHLIDEPVLRNNIADLAGGGNPFQQMTSNPHFSFPHGIMVWGFALFLWAELRNKKALYWVSGCMFALNGLIRPYDLISVALIFPVYAIVEIFCCGFNKKRFFLRLIPALIILPFLLYNVWLFKMHPIFGWWSMQGLNAGVMPPLYKNIQIFGIAGVLALVRIFFAFRRQPLSSGERFLLVWFISIFGLIHVGIILPVLGFSPQLGISLTGPLVLLGMATALPSALRTVKLRRWFIDRTTSVILLFVFAGSSGVIAYFTLRFLPNRNNDAYYARSEEVAAWKWLNHEGVKDKVILASPKNSSRLCKYTSAATVVGHYSVSPRYEYFTASIKRHFSGSDPDPEACGMLSTWNVDYIFIGQGDDSVITAEALKIPCVSPVFHQGGVTIFRHLSL